MRMAKYKSPYGVSIHCICGKDYVHNRQQFCTCPFCEHVWNLHPPDPKVPAVPRRMLLPLPK